MMYIGVRAHDYGRHEPKALAKLVAADGFATIQLAPTKVLSGVNKFDDITDAALDETREAFAAAGLKISVYGCYQEIGDLDEAKRRLALDRFCAGAAHAKRVGAPFIATETTRFEGSDAKRDGALEQLAEGVFRMASAAREHGVMALLEPVALHTLNSARLARALLDRVNSPHLGIVFDPVNMLTEDNLDRQDKIWDEYFELLGPDIAAVHLKDVDEHLQWRNLGEGIVHYDRIFPRMGALGRDLPLLREHVRPESAHVDIAAIRAWMKG